MEAECIGDVTCNVAEKPTPVTASALIQVRAAKGSDCAPARMEAVHLVESSTCVSAELQEAHLQALRYYAASLATGTSNASQSAPVDGYTASLDATGFYQVTSMCCPLQTERFWMRLLDSRGLKPCYQHDTLGTFPHIQGLMHWFTCVPGMDFNYVLSIIDYGNPCKWWAPKSSECPALTPECNKPWCR